MSGFQGLIPVVMENVKKGVISWTTFSRLRMMIRVITYISLFDS